MMWEADKITEIFLLAPFNTTSGEAWRRCRELLGSGQEAEVPHHRRHIPVVGVVLNPTVLAFHDGDTGNAGEFVRGRHPRHVTLLRPRSDPFDGGAVS